MLSKVEEIKNKTQEVENKVKNGNFKLFNWGWFKFCKCLLGITLYTLSINLFVVPNHLYTGGILGLSQIIRTTIISTFNINTNFDISSVIYYLINVPLLVLAYKKISKEFFFRTIFTVTLNSLFLFVIPIPEKPIIENLLANTLIAGIISGLGVGMILSTGSSSGGTDIIGTAINRKYDKASVGNIALVFNVIIYSITGLNYGIEIMIYSIIFSVFEAIILDRNHTLNIKSEAIIFTKNDPSSIMNFINYELKRGATYWEAYGGYTHTNTYIIYTVLSKYERMRLERHMNEFDENAFMIGKDGVVVKGNFRKYLI